MPLYTFECATCGARFELAQHMADQTMPDCPHGHHTVHRVFTPPTVIFRGAGFYVTDHRRGEKSKHESATV